MSTTMTAQEIGEAWLAYVTETFMLENGCVRPEVEEEYKRLESKDTITQERELWRTYTDELIDKILQSTPETRTELLSATDSRSLAYVQDRVQCGTELLTALVQKGLKLNMEDDASLPDYFRQILLQKQA
ncbi:MAG: hypothetical protein JJE30_19315 [Desulfuromonadales bacterium]|nr:hypothetical protein [Desulfuromonadales bacterium]